MAKYGNIFLLYFFQKEKNGKKAAIIGSFSFLNRSYWVQFMSERKKGHKVIKENK